VTTRERLLREGLRLFAEHGFAGTSVGAIEAAAGLQPRRGALYRHFASKEALLAAAVQRYNDLSREAAGTFTQVAVEDPRELAMAVGRGPVTR
jgi:AcrR family transcriptional regulator